MKRLKFKYPLAATVCVITCIAAACNGYITSTEDLLNGRFRDKPQVAINVLDSDLIRVMYDQNMDSAKICAASNYEILGEEGEILEVISAAPIPGAENTTIKIKTGEQTSLKNYFLLISNVETISGRDLEGSKIQAQFIGFNSEAINLPGIQSVLVKNGTLIQIIYDHAMAPAGLTDAGSYSISGTSGSLAIVTITSLDIIENRILELVTGFQTPGEIYTISVSGLQSSDGKILLPPGNSSTFSGYNTDLSPPDILAPASGTKITGLDVTLIWSNRDEAESYIVEIVKDDGTADPFSNPINDIVTGNPFTVNAPDRILEFGPAESRQLPGAYSYVWRVKTDISTDWSSISFFHAFDDTMYVHCPAAENCSEYTEGIGNKSKPYYTIQEAITQSIPLNLQVYVAKRDTGNTAYNESFVLEPGGRVYGGFDSITWTRGSGDKTKVESSNEYVVAVYGVKQHETILDSFELQSLSILEISYVIQAQNNDGSLKILNNNLYGGGDVYNASSYVIYNNTSSPLISGNYISVKGTQYASYIYGIYNQSSSPLIIGNIIAGGYTWTYFMSLLNYSSSAIIMNNTIIAGRASSFSTCIYTSTSSLIIANNTILSGPAQYWSTAIEDNESSSYITANLISSSTGQSTVGISVSSNFGNATSKINGNTIFGGKGTVRSYGINSTNSGSSYNSTPEIENNIIIIDGTGARKGIYEGRAGCSPDTVSNNTIVDIGTGGSFFYYADYVGSGGNCPSDTARKCYTDICSGNFGYGPCSTILTSPSGTANISASGISSLFQFYPSGTVITMDGTDGDAIYNGNTTILEVMDASECSKFTSGQYFEYLYDNNVYTIGASDCATNMTISFSPALNFDFGPHVPILLWGTSNSGYSDKYSLKSTSASLNTGTLGSEPGGLGCPGGFEGTARVHEWGDGTDQADCDSKYPFAFSTYNGGKCETSYLFPAIEIYGDSIGNDNGLCEQGETCLYNPNIGSYSGHGTLVNSGCDASAIISGITLMEYDTNGY